MDAIKELNISKRNVSLYFRDHPQTRESMGRAFNFLRKLFESRGNLTLGVAKDSLMIDETPLSKKILALKEFSLTLHHKGKASVTLPTTLKIEELFGYHELLTARETATGAALVELAGERGLGDIKLTPLDISKVTFVEDTTREEGGGSYIDDIEVNKKIVATFKKDQDGRFMDRGYREELKRISKIRGKKTIGRPASLRRHVGMKSSTGLHQG